MCRFIHAEENFFSPVPSSDMGILAVYLLAESADPALTAQIALRDKSVSDLRIAKAKKNPYLISRFVAGPSANLKNHSSDVDKSVSLGLSLPLIDEPLDFDIKIEEMGVKRASLQLEDYRQAHLLMVAESYFDVLSAEQDLLSSSAEIESFSSQLEQATERLRVGVGTRVDVDQGRAQLDLSKVRLIKLESDFENAKANLGRLIGMSIGALKNLSPDAQVGSLTTEDFSSEDFVESHPTVLVARNMLMEARLRVEKAKSFEKLSWSLNSDLNVSSGGDGSRRKGSVSLALEIPIFVGDRTNAAIASASNYLANMRAELEQERRLVRYNIEVADRNLSSGKRSLEALLFAIRSAESRVEATEAAYTVGSGDLIEVLNAKKDLIASQRDFEKARYQQVLNDLRKAASLGLLNIDYLKEIDRQLVTLESNKSL